ncbi:hypothetical protein [Agitococcus lubricus]|uniref:Lipoprotein n=1 Tax=Agitococcus lubricus TaxID=1077255 RepID=A0A2T5J274_9GAMM|nr:hypothetical protein [Agitococcus lubricus]PTQ90626.1 hypothetical protein C8N29_10225 [Agitococcus lubricus]
MSSRIIKYSPLVLALSLAACGGGSDDSNPSSGTTQNLTTAISTANQSMVAAEVTSNALNFSRSTLGDISSATFAVAQDNQGAETLNLRVLLTDIRQIMRDSAQATTPQVLAAAVSLDENCAISGKKNSSYDDKNGNQAWDVTESGTVTFTNCVMQSGGVTLNGAVKDEWLAESLTSTTDKFTFVNLKASLNSVSTELVSGVVSYTETTTGNLQNSTLQSTDRYVTTDLKVKATQNAKTENFTLNEDISLSQSSPNLNLLTITGSGVISSDNQHINGSIKFDITTPIVMDTTANPVTVSAGQMTISGSGGTALYLSFATPSTGQVTLQLKKDGANVGAGQVIDVQTLLAGVNAVVEQQQAQ